MSQGQTQLPDPQTAYNTLFSGIQADVFFQKIAAVRPDYYPQTEEQANYLLKMAGSLREVDQNQEIKKAEDAQHPFAQAAAFLDNRLEQYGMGKQAAEQESSIKRAAEVYANDPTYYNAVLSLKAAEAVQVAEHLKNVQAQRQQAAA